MGAARFAAQSRLTSDPEYPLKVERSRHEREVKALRDNFAKELAAGRDAVRRELTAEIVSVRRELLTVRSEAEQLRVAKADLQLKLQEGDATVTSLKADNAGLQRQLRALNNISAFLAGVARGEQQ
jgi:hypothetical protein